MLDALKQSKLVAMLMTAALAAAVQSGGALAVRERGGDWTPLHHAKRGFYISYPNDLFAPAEGAQNEDGVVLASRDGRAKLLVATFENTSDFSLSAYRDYLLQDSYAGAKVDYERTRDRWFVISGTRKDTMFYERVTFTCGGKLVNSWVMLYPVAERALYDRIVEGVARTYMPGAGAGGNCD